MRSLLRTFPLVALVAATACRDSAIDGRDSANADATPGGTMVIASAGDADVLVPTLSGAMTGHMVIDMVFDRLAEIGPDLNSIGDKGYKPRLARSWSWSDDSLSIAFALDPRARWHDGRPVRASDVKFSFDFAREPAVASRVLPDIANIDSVTVRDSLTAVVWFASRSPGQFFQAVRHVPIMPQHVYGSAAPGDLRGTDVARQPVGSGQWRFVAWEPGTRLELVADTANYLGRPYLDRVIWTFTADPAAALARMRAGEADYFETVPATQAASFDSLPNVRVYPYPSLQYAFLGMNQRVRGNGAAPHPVFGDIRVRRAIAHGLDVAAMLENVFSGYGKQSRGPVPAAMGIADSTIILPTYDTTRAKALLDSAAWVPGADGVRRKAGQPLRFSLLVPQSSAPRMAYAVLIQEQLRRLGMQVDIETVDFPTFVVRGRERDFDAALQGWGTDPGPTGFHGRWSSQSANSGGENVEGYRSPVTDAHVDSAVAEYDAERMRAHMQRAFAQLNADVPAVWLYEPVSIAAAHERIRTAPYRADKWWAYISDWYIPEAERIARDRIGLRPAPTP